MENMKVNYEVNPYTMAIIAVKHNSGKVYSKVIESEDEFFVKMKPLAIIEESCSYFGASLKGRQEGTRRITGITHKAPIGVEPCSGIYMFPTTSPQTKNCNWVAHSHIYNVKAINSEQIEVTFMNKKSYIFNVSKGSFENQMYRTAQFRFMLTSRISGNHSTDYFKSPQNLLI